ncbi:hypothetical protein COV23_02150 [Candidatus Wolfebacteria bacterium CG10_big_fil_rev_8_21_14_0_10_31_9]|uniref:NlpC/P60 domain-containing protein n=1 Tax=Candidatus Wolfebacteria bacterium CG10_big_fil_rev_8_21_14_0_10_31_9 TaxID=1975070 RepID=A0A2H0RC11_9BACT|nr:MAG: hypothetical protein COV23_02150 [Candidatus Wolfebacteria bacterium CG10_big_fil_rev_8_21_14_0_10_31_9]
MARTEKIKNLIETARSFIGMPYKYGSYLESSNEIKPNGFDCSSFSQYVFKQIGIDLPRSSILQAASELGQEIPIDKIEPGDLLFFESTKGHYWHSRFPQGRKIYIGHLAIYTGNGNVIHSADNAEINPILQGVVEHNIDILPKEFYEIVIAKRFI